MLKFFILIYLSFSSFLFAEKNEPQSPVMICDHTAAMSSELLLRTLNYRESAFNTCLRCEGPSCKMKSWPKEKKGDEAICKRIFCTPANVNKNYEVPADSPRGRSKFSYSYEISKKGKIKDFKILNYEGAHKPRDIVDYLKAYTKKTSYEPLVYDGKEYEITNLGFSMSVHLKHDWE